jgi:thiosulfate reductase cytochrome b subunit
MVQVSGACLGLFAFAVTVLAGLAAGNPATAILSRALWAMAAFFLLGCVLGYVALRVIDEHAIRRHRELFGSPRSDDAAGAADAGAAAKPADPAAEPGPR